MKYYRVKPEHDQRPRIKYSRYPKNRKPWGIYVANELYTATELKQLYVQYERFSDIFEEVRIPKNQIYWFFGCRFAIDTDGGIK